MFGDTINGVKPLYLSTCSCEHFRLPSTGSVRPLKPAVVVAYGAKIIKIIDGSRLVSCLHCSPWMACVWVSVSSPLYDERGHTVTQRFVLVRNPLGNLSTAPGLGPTHKPGWGGQLCSRFVLEHPCEETVTITSQFILLQTPSQRSPKGAPRGPPTQARRGGGGSLLALLAGYARCILV